MHGYSLSHLWHLASYTEATMLMSFLSKLTDSLYVQKSWEKKITYVCMFVCVSHPLFSTKCRILYTLFVEHGKHDQ